MDGLEDLSRRRAVTQNQLDPTRARPQPWFVGSGRGLMIAVVVAVLVLLMVRGASTVMLAEEAWDWWRHRPVETAPAGVLPVPSPPGRATVDQAEPGSFPRGAVAVGSPADWITADDYPPASMRAGEQGRSAIRWTIDTGGRVSACEITQSSGAPRLDAAACSAIMRRGRYRPALDRRGRPIAEIQHRRVVWRLPED